MRVHPEQVVHQEVVVHLELQGHLEQPVRQVVVVPQVYQVVKTISLTTQFQDKQVVILN
jgi:hypothetical protein